MAENYFHILEIWLFSAVVGLVFWPSILLSHKQPVSMLAWLLSVTLLPVVGALLFVLVGRDRIKRGLVRRKRASDRKVEPGLARMELQAAAPSGMPLDTLDMGENVNLKALLHLQDRLSGPPLTWDNQVALLQGAHKKYPRLWEDIAQAKDHVHLEYYLLKEDRTGDRLADLLSQTVARGVKVYLLLDSLGSLMLSRSYLAGLKASGVRVSWFHPLNPLRRRWSLNLRNHRKLAIIDGRIGYLGGMNLGDEYLGERPQVDLWEDLAVRIEGSAVRSLERIFMEDWRFSTGELPTRAAYASGVSLRPHGSMVQIMPSGPDEDRDTLHRVYFGALTTARRQAWLVTPYFLPDESFQQALESAALRGVDVRVLLPKRSDNRLVDFASRAVFESMLEAGVRIFLYQPGMLHAKSLLVDQSWSAVGTANLDVRSLRLNFEAGALIYDRQVAQALEGFCLRQMAQAQEAQVTQYQHRPWWLRAAESLIRLLSPLL